MKREKGEQGESGTWKCVLRERKEFMSVHRVNQFCFIYQSVLGNIMLDCGSEWEGIAQIIPSGIARNVIQTSLEEKRKEEQAFLFALPEWKQSAFFPKDIEEWGRERERYARKKIATPMSICADALNTNVQTHWFKRNIQAVFISHAHLGMGLPFLTERMGLNCPIYTTEPVLMAMQLILEELYDTIRYADNVGTLPFDFYSADEITSFLSRIKLIRYDCTIDIAEGLTGFYFRIFVFQIVECIPSGASLGSASFFIRAPGHALYYCAFAKWKSFLSAQEPAHLPFILRTKQKQSENVVESFPLHILLPCLTLKSSSNELAIRTVIQTLEQTISRGGSILFPISFDLGNCIQLLEVVSAWVLKYEKECPIFLVGSKASSCLQYASIAVDSVQRKRQDMAVTGQPVFPFQDLIKKGHAHVFLHAMDLFDQTSSSQFHFTPLLSHSCIVFASHPSLRFGDALLLLPMFAANEAHAIILTDSNFPSPFVPFVNSSFLCTIVDAFFELKMSETEICVFDDLHPCSIVVGSEQKNCADVRSTLRILDNGGVLVLPTNHSGLLPARISSELYDQMTFATDEVSIFPFPYII